jgi:Flp pilus assembly protein TadD
MQKLPLGWAALAIAALAAGCGEAPAPGPESAPPARPADAQASGGRGSPFVGATGCRECHEEFYTRWATSNHGLAMRPYTPTLAKTKLTPQTVDTIVGTRKYRAEIGPGQGWVREEGPDGQRKHPIAQVMGGKNVYYFLTPRERGRLQVLPVAYDVHKQSWYDMASSGIRHFADRQGMALDWTDRMFTFNTACFNCHVTQLATNFDLATDSYHTTWSEPGISCEACHGPAGEHVRVMRAAGNGQKPADMKIIRTKQFSAEQLNDMCATCHAKLVPLSMDFRPGDRFFDHFDLVGLEHPDYYPDGRDLGENYTYTSWLMSPCLTSGKLDCNHCHTSSGRMRFEAGRTDLACMPCHAKQVNNPTEHGHHRADGPGNRCIACHMPTTRFAGMGRTDHSMRSPSPAATLALKSPNACNLCHADQDAVWADRWVRQWYKRDYQADVVRKAGLIQEARKAQWQHLSEMLAAARAKDNDAVYRTSLVRLLRACPEEKKWPAMRALLGDPSPLVRSSAVSALGDQLTEEHAQMLVRACGDSSRLVRIRSAAALAPIRPEQLADAKDRQHVEKAIGEIMAAMRARPDDWASYANLGDFSMQRRDFLEAIRNFEIATKLEPRMVGPWVNASIAYSNMNRPEEAERSLLAALKLDPTNAAVNFNLGLLLGERGRVAEAERALRTALKSDPQMAAAAYNLAVLIGKRNLDEACSLCRQAWKLRPNEPKYAHTLAFFLRAKGDAAAAAAVYREAAKMPGLSVESVRQLEEKARAVERAR